MKTGRHIQRKRRKQRVRKRIGRGTAERPRLSVFRSNKHIYAQLINDIDRKTIVAVSTETNGIKGTGTERAHAIGERIAQAAKKEGITRVLFDRGSYLYHGRVKALADGAREKGLIL